jgi:hypothetical protein
MDNDAPRSETHRLVPLRSVITGQEIEGFPETGNDIALLTGAITLGVLFLKI